MPEHRPHYAALAQRGRLLSQTRTITLGIAGGAALASIGLGTAFAHSIPGHSYHPVPRPAAAARPGPAVSSTAPARSARPARHARSGHHRTRHHHAIAPPARPPAPAPATSSAPPPVTSGGT